MGVGYASDLIVCVALGVDMFDCVYPTRTARFGNALVPWGKVSLKQAQYINDPLPIDPDCDCLTCQKYSRSYLNSIVTKETVACHLVSIHNISYQLKLMRGAREAIKAGCFPEYVVGFLDRMYAGIDNTPQWIIEALASVNIDIFEKRPKKQKMEHE
jgi:tRNA-guanine family transglycosylase